MIDRDLHIHSFFSPCADPAMSFTTIVEAAEKAGLADIGISDHPFRPGLARHHEALRRAREDYGGPVRIWIGAELEVSGLATLYVPPNELPDADYFIAAPSHYDLLRAPPVPHMDDPMEWADRLMTDMENVPHSGAAAIAHPFFVYALQVGSPPELNLPFVSQVIAEIRPKRMERLLDRLAADRIAVEISPRCTYLPAFEAFMEGFFRQAKAAGIRFLLGSDSHRPDSIGKLGKAEDMIRRLELKSDDLWHPEQARRSR